MRWIPRRLILMAAAMGCTLLGGCGDDPADASLSTCTTTGPVVTILDNHLPSGGDHKLVVPAEDVVAGVERVYDIRGDNVGHTHTVTLSAPHFASLKVGDSVSVVSSNNGPVGFGHDHVVRLSCP